MLKYNSNTNNNLNSDYNFIKDIVRVQQTVYIIIVTSGRVHDLIKRDIVSDVHIAPAFGRSIDLNRERCSMQLTIMLNNKLYQRGVRKIRVKHPLKSQLVLNECLCARLDTSTYLLAYIIF